MSESMHQNALALVAKIMPANESPEDFPTEMKELSRVINSDLPAFLKEDAPSNSPEVYFEFQHEFDKFVDFIKFNRLANRNIVALGGSFSSGKSSFLNAFLGRRILPSEIEPTTSVPTYIINGKEDCVNALNLFGSKLSLEIPDLKTISHDFTSQYGITLGRLLQKVYIELPQHPYQNLAFLDTPGYSKPDTITYSKSTDEKIARAQLNSSNFILWFVNVENGTIPESDIQFLVSLKSDIPKLIIVNKCDKKEIHEVNKIITLVKDTLIKKGILIEGVLPYSCRKPKMFPIEPIQEFFGKWNHRKLDLSFSRNFKLLFMECGRYFDRMLQLDGKRRERISKAMVEIQNDVLFSGLNELIKEIDNNRKRFREKESRLLELRMEFFTLLKKIGDAYHIPLPEPNEIDLIRESAPNPRDIISQFRVRTGKDTSKYNHMLQNHLNKNN